MNRKVAFPASYKGGDAQKQPLCAAARKHRLIPDIIFLKQLYRKVARKIYEYFDPRVLRRGAVAVSRALFEYIHRVRADREYRAATVDHALAAEHVFYYRYV